jgi:hypothetical protein
MSHYLHVLEDFAKSLNDAQHRCTSLTDASQANTAIYRNNVELNRGYALRTTYPTIVALLGEDFFDAMVLIYVRQCAAKSANLHAEGQSLVDFIAQFAPASDYPYLSDVAQLDWAIHAAHYAPDAQPISAQVIAEHAADLAELCFTLHPAVSLLKSNWPIASILAMHHGEAAPSDLNAAECVLVWRDQYARIDTDQALFLSALQDQQSLAAALERTAQFNEVFDPAETLGLLLQQGLITGLQKNTAAH